MSGRDVGGRGYLPVGGGKRAGGGEVDGEAVCHWRAGMRVMGMDFKRAGGTAGGMGHVVDGGYASRWVGGGIRSWWWAAGAGICGRVMGSSADCWTADGYVKWAAMMAQVAGGGHGRRRRRHRVIVASSIIATVIYAKSESLNPESGSLSPPACS